MEVACAVAPAVPPTSTVALQLPSPPGPYTLFTKVVEAFTGSVMLPWVLPWLPSGIEAQAALLLAHERVTWPPACTVPESATSIQVGEVVADMPAAEASS